MNLPAIDISRYKSCGSRKFREGCPGHLPVTETLGPTPKSAYALLLFRQSRFRWQVVLNQETKCRTHGPERVAYTAPPSTPRDGDDQPRPQGFSVKMGGGAVGTRLGDDQSIEERRLVISEVNTKEMRTNII